MKNIAAKNFLIGASIFSLGLVSFCTRTKISIEPLTFLDTVVTGKSYDGKKFINKLSYYKVTGYRGTKDNFKYIDDFVKRTKDANLDKYSYYTISFFTAADEANKTALRQHPDRYYNQDNIIYEYRWANGKFSAMFKYKDGKIIEPEQKIKIKDAPLDSIK